MHRSAMDRGRGALQESKGANAPVARRQHGAAEELLREENPPVNQIKASLTALRAAKKGSEQNLAQARENLRQITTPRQEALLVLNGLRN